MITTPASAPSSLPTPRPGVGPDCAVALLIAIFPANIYLFQHQEILPAPPILHLLRLPLQGLLILWAFAYTRGPRELPSATDRIQAGDPETGPAGRHNR